MSDRREKLKKILNISEYPWSSDEDETQRQFLEPTTSSADASSSNSQPGPSGNSGQNMLVPAIIDHLFSINNPYRSGAYPVRSRFGPAASSSRRGAHEGMQRIMAIRAMHCSRKSGSGTPNANVLDPIRRMEYNKLNLRSSYENCRRVEPAPPRREPSLPAPGPAPAPAPAPAGRFERVEPLRFHYDDNEPPSSVLPPMDPALLPDPIEVDSPNVSLEEIVELDMDCDPPVSNADPPVPTTDPPAPPPVPTTEEPVADTSAEPVPSTSNRTAEVSSQPHGVKRKRESSVETNEVSEPNTFKELNQNLLRLLECPVCLDWMEPPMAQCRRGHMLCGRCRARLASCPVCRTGFSSMRNRAMEGVAEMLRYPCRHGCGREVRLRRRSPHEASCPARRYRCPAPNCDHQPLPLKDLPNHLQEKHSSIVKLGRKHKFSLKMNTEQRQNWVVVTLHELFHLRIAMDANTWGATAYVAYIGPKCNAKNYIYEVTVSGLQNWRKIVYSRTTHSDLESSSVNMSRQDCFHMPLDQAINFLRAKNREFEADNMLTFTIDISKCEQDGVREDTDS